MDYEKHIYRLLDVALISAHLVNKNIFKEDQKKRILGNKTQESKSKQFLSTLLNQGSRKAYEILVSTLKETKDNNHLELANILENNTDEPREASSASLEVRSNIHSDIPVDPILIKNRYERITQEVKNHESRICVLEHKVVNDSEAEEVLELQKELESRAKDLDNLKRELQEQAQALNDANSEMLSLKELNSSLEEKIKTLESKIVDLRRMVQDCKRESTQAKEEVQKLKQEIADDKIKLQEAMDKMQSQINNMARTYPPKGRPKIINPRNRFQSDSNAEGRSVKSVNSQRPKSYLLSQKKLKEK